MPCFVPTVGTKGLALTLLAAERGNDMPMTTLEKLKAKLEYLEIEMDRAKEDEDEARHKTKAIEEDIQKTEGEIEEAESEEASDA